jgi:hypothetical protein
MALCDEYKGGPIFRKVLVNLDLVETRHKSMRLPNNTIRNPAIAAPRLLWLSTGTVPVDLAKKAKSFAYESKNTSKNKKECNQFVAERLISRVRVSQTDKTAKLFFTE